MRIGHFITLAIVILAAVSCGYVEETDFIQSSGETSGSEQAFTKAWTFDQSSDYSAASGSMVSGGYAGLASDFFDTDWQYRIPVSIDNTGNASDLTAYQVVLALADTDSDFWSGIETDGGSIRFTDSNKSTQLDYFVDSFDYPGESARLYIGVPLIPGSSVKTVYLYFGNSAVSSLSSGQNTLHFYDDFESGDLGWQQYSSGSVAIFSDAGNGVLRKYNNSDPNGGYRTFSSSIGPFEAVFRTKRVNFSGGGANRYGVEDSGFNGYGPLFNNFDAVSDLYIEERSSGSGTGISATKNPSLSSLTWYTVQLRRAGSAVDLVLFDASGTIVDSVSATDSTVSSFDRFAVHGGYEFYTDDIRIRQYTSPDPSASLGQLETTYHTDRPSITPKTGQAYTGLISFSETTASSSEGSVQYQISNDSASWYWWNGSVWTGAGSAAEANTAPEVNTQISRFATDVGTGTFFFRAFLVSDGTQKVQLDAVALEYR